MRGYVALLLLLAAIWGASFMFIKIAVDELAPTTTMFLRLAFSALPLLALVVYKLGVRQAWDQLRAITKAAVILGIVNTRSAVHPDRLGRDANRLGRGRDRERVAADLRRDPRLLLPQERERDRVRLFGVLLGLAGVAVLTGVHPKGGLAGAVGTLAVIAASFAYAVGTLYTQSILKEVRNDVLAAASITWGAVWLAPLGDRPRRRRTRRAGA